MRLPQADRKACAVAKVGDAVPDEAGLGLEGLEHPRLGGVRDLLEAALVDLVRSDSEVLHVCSPLLGWYGVLTARGGRESQIECRKTLPECGLVPARCGGAGSDAIP